MVVVICLRSMMMVMVMVMAVEDGVRYVSVLTSVNSDSMLATDSVRGGYYTTAINRMHGLGSYLHRRHLLV